MATLATEPGRGRKHCPGCGKYPGVRSRVCPGCGHEFAASAKAKTVPRRTKKPSSRKAETETEEDEDDTPLYRETSIVWTPRGEPVALPAEHTKENIRAWMEQCREECRDGYLSTEALVYWARQIYPSYKKNEEGAFVRDNTSGVLRGIIEEIDAPNERAR